MDMLFHFPVSIQVYRSNNKVCLGLHSGDLVRIWEDFSTTILMSSVGNDDMVYETLRDGYIVFTNNTIIGQLKDEVASLFPATTREFKSVMPAGNMLAYFQGSRLCCQGKRSLYLRHNQPENI